MNRYRTFLLAIVAVVAVAVMFQAYPAQADISCNGNGVKVSNAFDRDGNPDNNCIGGGGTNPIYKLIAVVVQYATAVFGLLFVLMIVIAGLQYVVSGSSPDTAKSAKERIQNAVTAFVLLMFMFGILQLLLPSDVRIFAP